MRRESPLSEAILVLSPRRVVAVRTSSRRLDMDSPPVLVLHADRILSAFGYWPSFHDAEVHRAELDRGIWPSLPSVTLVIHAFDSDGTVDEKGYYRIRTSVLVTLRFDAVDDLELRGPGLLPRRIRRPYARRSWRFRVSSKLATR
jgi:hypothetical protein